MSSKGNNIILCGFMGSGKTTLGGLLAQMLGIRFLDMDDVITARMGIDIPQIFAYFGEGRFRDEEHAAAKMVAGSSGIVLATGGGALTYPRNVEVLRESGIIIYLNPGFSVCYGRIADSDRPLVRRSSPEQLEELYQERQEKYRAVAGLEVTASTAEEMAQEILGTLA